MLDDLYVITYVRPEGIKALKVAAEMTGTKVIKVRQVNFDEISVTLYNMSYRTYLIGVALDVCDFDMPLFYIDGSKGAKYTVYTYADGVQFNPRTGAHSLVNQSQVDFLPDDGEKKGVKYEHESGKIFKLNIKRGA